MRVMVVGQGGREHALAWKLSGEAQVEHVLVAPGNAGTAGSRIDAHDIPAWLAAADEHGIDLTVAGPEQPLVDGIADAFHAQGRMLFGPAAATARLECSKIYAKALMDELGIQTAAWTAVRQPSDADDFLQRHAPPYAVKADGLAGGKGVAIAADRDEARELIAAYLAGKFGAASRQLVLEEFLKGEERSLLALCDGAHAVPLPLVRDYKRLGTGDTGPNTGGMGAVCPAPAPAELDEHELCAAVIQPVLDRLRAQGTSYIGCMYAGLMLLETGGYAVLEYNCRFGDPEAQAVLPLLDDSLAELLRAAAAGELAGVRPRWRDRVAVCVTIAAPGYPGPEVAETRAVVPAAPAASVDEEMLLFHANTRPLPSRPSTYAIAGGRAFSSVGVAPSRARARELAYQQADSIELADAVMRRDIGT